MSTPEFRPSAPPRRRRRQAFSAAPLGDTTPQNPPSGVPVAERIPESTVSRVVRPRKRAFRCPSGLRVALIVLIAVLLLVAGVTITRRYLDVQAQRRRAQEEAALRARHPLYYREEIERAAAEQGLPPALLCAVILCESSYDPFAESRLGARGLMQLMAPTAEWIAEKLRVENYAFDMLYDVETNLRFGAWYLAYLARRFDGDALKVVCAYHAGQGNVDAWLENPLYSADGVTLTTIPTDDTATYARRVLSAYEVYQAYYYPPAVADDGDAAAARDSAA